MCKRCETKPRAPAGPATTRACVVARPVSTRRCLPVSCTPMGVSPTASPQCASSLSRSVGAFMCPLQRGSVPLLVCLPPPVHLPTHTSAAPQSAPLPSVRRSAYAPYKRCKLNAHVANPRSACLRHQAGEASKSASPLRWYITHPRTCVHVVLPADWCRQTSAS